MEQIAKLCDALATSQLAHRKLLDDSAQQRALAEEGKLEALKLRDEAERVASERMRELESEVERNEVLMRSVDELRLEHADELDLIRKELDVCRDEVDRLRVGRDELSSELEALRVSHKEMSREVTCSRQLARDWCDAYRSLEATRDVRLRHLEGALHRLGDENAMLKAELARRDLRHHYHHHDVTLASKLDSIVEDDEDAASVCSGAGTLETRVGTPDTRCGTPLAPEEGRSRCKVIVHQHNRTREDEKLSWEAKRSVVKRREHLTRNLPLWRKENPNNRAYEEPEPLQLDW